MASQNMDPAANSSNAARKGTETGSSAARGSVTKRLQQELMTLMMSGDKGISAFPESDNLFKWIGTIDGAKETMSGDKGISAFPESDNLFKWIGTIDGAKETVYEGLRFKLSLEFPSGYPFNAPMQVYEGLRFKLSLEFPSGYPFNAPTVRFITPCFHPNVDTQGFICLDILKDKWSALYDVRSILMSIQSLLGEPNNESPLNANAAELWADQEGG
ncbi:UNVERIFIED_CONTAM: hypothetical protein FKN15_077855 [Acipenser sinensis]